MAEDDDTRGRQKGIAFTARWPLTQGIFAALAFWMLVFGVLVGLLFPFLANLLGVPADRVFVPRFYVATTTAGLVVGGASFLLARWIVRPRLRLLAGQMHEVAESIEASAFEAEPAVCDPRSCKVALESADELGECAGAFNSLVDALAQAQEVEAALARFSAAMSGELELAPLAERALDLLLKYSGAAGGAVVVELDGELATLARRGLSQDLDLEQSDPIRRVMRRGEPRRLELVPDLAIDAGIARMRPREVALLPVGRDRVRLGVVVLAATRVLESKTLRLVNLLVRSFGLALHNALTHDQLQRTAALDPLTGAYNRRFGMARLGEELNRARRTGASLAVVLLDADHFKEVNDRYGHQVGDAALVSLVRTTGEISREGDILTRYGGEEFMLLLPGISRDGGRQMAERLRRIVEETEVPTEGRSLRLTISAGVAAHPEDCDACDGEALLRIADQALYAAKEGGRNRVCTAPDPEPGATPRTGNADS